MRKVSLLLVILLIQICNLDVKGNGFEIQSNTLLQASTLEVSKIEAKESKYDTVQIQTSAVCKMCKERLEHDLAFEKGVTAVELDIETKVLTIVYKKSKTTEKDLRVAVTMVGYDADDMLADQKAHDKLPACCQKGVDPH